jgi:hypothetical protein
MDGFKKIVLFSAVIILIISLVLIGVALSYAKDETWPPMVPNCPDYFIIDGSGNEATCVDIKDLAASSSNPICLPPPGSKDKHLRMKFNTPTFKGSNGNCNKYNWATTCGVSWDGITYGAKNPCQTETQKQVTI